MLCFALSGALRSATLEGRITSEKGKPIGNIGVSVARSLTDGLVANPITYRTTTDNSGKFSVEISASGTYVICANSYDEELLDSCQWPNSSASIRIDASQKKIQASVALQRATTMRIRIDDPQHLLPNPQGPNPGVILQVGVYSQAGRYYQARLVSSDQNGLNFEILVPPSSTIRPAIDGAGIRVFDSNGLQVDFMKDTASFQTRANESDQVRRFQVTK